jgi:hypothetical protein
MLIIACVSIFVLACVDWDLLTTGTIPAPLFQISNIGLILGLVIIAYAIVALLVACAYFCWLASVWGS